jgi:hypothetical protein
MNKVYNVEDLFQDIPGDSGNVMLTFPPELIEETGWKTGDNLNIELIEGRIHIQKVDVVPEQQTT